MAVKEHVYRLGRRHVRYAFHDEHRSEDLQQSCSNASLMPRRIENWNRLYNYRLAAKWEHSS
jgi:hypothetical protein